MSEMFIKKILDKDFGTLTLDELQVIINSDSVFSLSKKDKKILEKAVNEKDLEKNKDNIIAVLKEGLPNAFAILSALDKYEVNECGIEINYRKSLLDNLNRMNNLQLCIFIDKVIMVGEESKIRFFRNQEYSLHIINDVISKSLGLTLVFEIFKPGKYKTFMDLGYNWIDKKQMVDAIDNQVVRYLYILKIISDIVLSTEETKLTGTKINKNIREDTAQYVRVIKNERAKVRKTGVIPKQTWTYVIGGLTDITVEDDDEFFEEEDYE